VFDLAFAALLVAAMLRARRAASALGVGLAAASLLLFAAVSALALAGDRSSWGLAGVLGVAFVGPSAILQDRAGALGVMTNPLASALAFAAASAGAAVNLARRARDLYPEGDEARALHKAEVAFVAVASFAGVRVVTALLAFAMFRGP
jgi:hypothetical protein